MTIGIFLSNSFLLRFQYRKTEEKVKQFQYALSIAKAPIVDSVFHVIRLICPECMEKVRTVWLTDCRKIHYHIRLIWIGWMLKPSTIFLNFY